MPEPSIYALVCVLVVTALAAVWDLRTGEIPNRLLGICAVVSFATLVAASFSPGGAGLVPTLLATFAGFVMVSLVPGLLYRSGGIGGGDVKLLALVGAALGPLVGLEVEITAFVVAILYAPMRLIWEGKLARSVKMIGQLALRPLTPKHRRPAPIAFEEMTSLRFGPAIFVGALLTAVHRLGNL